MNCSEIHEGLPQKEVRDFLSLQLVLAFEADGDNKKKIFTHHDYSDTFEWAKADAREQIRYLTKYIQNIENKQAILKLIENNGWKEFDVSDDIHNDTDHRLGMEFIGTEREHDNLMRNLYPDNG
jgi:hypothetical protein